MEIQYKFQIIWSSGLGGIWKKKIKKNYLLPFFVLLILVIKTKKVNQSASNWICMRPDAIHITIPIFKSIEPAVQKLPLIKSLSTFFCKITNSESNYNFSKWKPRHLIRETVSKKLRFVLHPHSQIVSSLFRMAFSHSGARTGPLRAEKGSP